MHVRADSVETLYDATLVDILAGAVSIPIYVLAWKLVGRIWRDQRQTAALRSEDATGLPADAA